MSSDVDICNIALSHVGADAIVSAIDPPDGSVEAGHCARFYAIARRTLLELGDWQWATKRVALAQVTNESDIWQYAYEQPSDCINALRILRPTASTNGISYTDPFGTLQPLVPSYYIAYDESNGAQFEIEGSTIYTNEPNAVLKYTFDVTDTAKFTPSFVDALGYMLASYLAGPIVKGLPGLQLGQGLRKIAQQMAAAASASSADNSMAVHEPVVASIRART